MIDTRMRLLTEQEKVCLRLVPLNTTDEIARATGLSPETVRTYIKRACDKLNVSRRADAARLLLSTESCPPQHGSPLQGTDMSHSDAVSAARAPVELRDLLPIRKKGAIGNDLSVALRLGAVLGIAIAAAIGFGMLAVGLRVIGELFWRR